MKIPSGTLARLAALPLLLATTASAAPHGIYWLPGVRPERAAASDGLRYYGGPVLDHVKVYAVFWGSGVAAATRAGIGPFYRNMLDSGYMDWLSEYDTNISAVDGRPGTGQHIGRGEFAGAITLKLRNATRKLSDADIRKELEAQVAAGALPPEDGETLYMVYFPADVSISDDGGSCSSFCGYHDAFKTADGSAVFYGVIPDCGSGCGGASAFDGITITSSHECVEAVTDPFPTPGNHPAYPQAWNAADGDEIGDLCEDGNSPLTGHGVTDQVQWEWDNSINACAQGPWSGSEDAARASVSPSDPGAGPHPLLDALREHPETIFGR